MDPLIFDQLLLTTPADQRLVVGIRLDSRDLVVDEANTVGETAPPNGSTAIKARVEDAIRFMCQIVT